MPYFNIIVFFKATATWFGFQAAEGRRNVAVAKHKKLVPNLSFLYNDQTNAKRSLSHRYKDEGKNKNRYPEKKI